MNTTFQTKSVIGFNNISSSQLTGILTNAVGSITGCLLSCSNQGSCSYDSVTKQIGCVCNQYYSGQSCQYDSRPCSSNPCLNSGMCSNIFSQNSSSFTCECNSLYYGTYCEKQKNLCVNSTCNTNQGYCKMNGSMTTCVCFYGYFGVDCDETSGSLKTRNTIVSVTSILAIIILALFVCFIFLMDYLKYFVFKDKRVKETKNYFDKITGRNLQKNIFHKIPSRKIIQNKKTENQVRSKSQESKIKTNIQVTSKLTLKRAQHNSSDSLHEKNAEKRTMEINRDNNDRMFEKFKALKEEYLKNNQFPERNVEERHENSSVAHNEEIIEGKDNGTHTNFNDISLEKFKKLKGKCLKYKKNREN